jgi:hypothetical protein
MNRARLLALCILGLLCTVPARANAIYTWVTLTDVGQPGDFFPNLLPLTFSDSVIASGGFSYFCGAPFDCPQGLGPVVGGLIVPSNGLIHLTVQVGFNADGTLTGHTRFLDMGLEYDLFGSEFDWSGTYNSDFYNCRDPRPCQVTGYWKGNPIPEPSTWSLFLIGLGAIVFSLRNRRQSYSRPW